MLRIYPVCLSLVREVRPLIDRIGRCDRDHARQLRRSIMSMALNVSEGSGHRGGRRRMRYEDALGSARESLANLELATAAGYLDEIDGATRNRFDNVIGVLVKIVY